MTTENKKTKDMPNRKAQKMLPPEWLVKTAGLAIKRGTSVIVTPSGTVYGVLCGSGGNGAIQFPADEEWVHEILRINPKGTVFPTNDVFGGLFAKKALRPYANFRLKEAASAWIDETTGVVHIKSGGVRLASGMFSETASYSDLSEEEVAVETVDFSEIPNDAIRVLTASVSKDPTRPVLFRIFCQKINKRAALVSTDSRIMTGIYLPDMIKNFSFVPGVISLQDIVAFGYKEVDGCELRRFVLRDGTIFTEKTSGIFPPNASQVADGPLNEERMSVLPSDRFSEVMGYIGKLGLGFNDTNGGSVTFQNSSVVVTASGAEVAEVEVDTSLPPDTSVSFAVPYLTMLANMGFDLSVNAYMAICDNNVGFGILMGLRLTYPFN